MSANELAKEHIRYMVGGHARELNEIVYSIQFLNGRGDMAFDRLADAGISAYFIIAITVRHSEKC
jgi:hypothetical protein